MLSDDDKRQNQVADAGNMVECPARKAQPSLQRALERCDLAIGMASNEGAPDYELEHIAGLLRGANAALAVPCPCDQWKADTVKEFDSAYDAMMAERDQLRAQHNRFFDTMRAIAVKGLGLTDPWDENLPDGLYPEDWAKF